MRAILAGSRIRASGRGTNFGALAGLALLLLGCQAGESTGRAATQREQGRLLLAHYQCTSCHAITRVPGTQVLAGPPLAQWGLRSYIAGHVPNSPDLLAQWIMDPASLAPGTLMPSMGVNAQDAAAMAAYLHALR